MTFQSTPPARGATLILSKVVPSAVISIHAPREGGDLVILDVKPQFLEISIHAPREGGDQQC